jgi:ribosomal protein S18 acetylase RimI-like enzyme
MFESSNAQAVTIRRATREDVETISKITDAAYERYVEPIGHKPQPMVTDYNVMVEAHPIWLLVRANETIGVLALEYAPDHLLIYSIAVAPQYQKQGWGKYLMQWAEQEAKYKGYREIRLYTNLLMQENIALYNRLGYIETGRETYVSSTRVYMAKQLE